MASNGNRSDMVTEEFKIFGKYMFEEFDQYMSGIRNILNKEVSSKTSLALKFFEDSITIWESPFATGRDVYKRVKSEIKDSRNLVKATKLAKLAEAWNEDDRKDDEMRKTLSKAILALYTSFYTIINSVTTKQSDKHALQILARAAVKNFITWYLNQPEEQPFSVQTITEGITTNVKTSGIFDDNKLVVYDRQTKKIEYNAAKLFTKSGLVVNDGNGSQPKLKYYVKHSSKYGYRYLFSHEIENKTEILKDYKEIQEPNTRNNLIKPELDTEIWRELLNVIKQEDPKQMESRLKEHMEQTMTSIVESFLSNFVEKMKNEFIASTRNDTSNTVPDSRMPSATSSHNIQGHNVQVFEHSIFDTTTFNFS